MDEKPDKGEKLIQLKWGDADNLPALYANHLLISHGNENEFYLVLGHLTPPLVFTEAEIPDVKYIEPIAKIVVSPESMRKFVSAMQKNLEKFEKRKKEK